MLQIRDICKEYRTGGLIQKALDHVSLNLRDSEFVAILGPSGSGKTTLLNVIGGLDRYDSGDLVINGISTGKYRDRDWDSYRNHTIGFVFQSYNLIPHQTILSNVELALTISGIGRSERRMRAVKALEQVGLGDQTHKKPNQLSGGQMQRVAIARALVNDPDIVLADEPTGALDSETSVQVMELLKNVARDRLVVMVTHNPELAREYATRIVNLRDGKIISDSDPFELDDSETCIGEHRNMGKASMSFLTALSLSFNNLKTKKARTLLTSFAGSIGIIGIALILSLSTGVSRYISTIEEETLSEYPLQIQSTGLDLTSMLAGAQTADNTGEEEKGDVHVVNMVTDMFSTMDTNDLESLKRFLESGDSGIGEYVNAIEYSYNIEPQIYREDGDSVRQVHPDRSFESLGLGSSSASNSMMSMMMSTNVFYEMPENENLYRSQYDVKAGRWPENYNECVLVLTSGGGMSDFLLYTLGLRDSLELDEMVRQFMNEEDVETPENISDYSYDDILGITFRLVNSADYYEYDSTYHVWKDKTSDEDYMRQLVENGEEMKIVGIVQQAEDAKGASLTAGLCYPASLTEHVAEEAGKREIVQKQLEDPSVNVFTGEAFGTASEEEFDMDSLITVDESRLKDAFRFDTGSVSGSVDFSDAFGSALSGADLAGSIDLSGVKIELPGMTQTDLGNILGSLDVEVSREGMAGLAESLEEGYREYAAEHPEADYSGLEAAFEEYLKTESAQNILRDNLREIMQTENGTAVTKENLVGLLAELADGYARFLTENEYGDIESADIYFREYLETDGVQEALDKWAQNIYDDIADEITVTPQQLEKLAGELADGYQNYAAEGNGPDPEKMPQYFLEYLATEDAKDRLTQGVAEIVDMDSLSSQISAAVEKYMQNAAASYGEAVSRALEQQIASAVSQITGQLALAMEKSMGTMMEQVGNSLQNAISVDADAFADAFQMNMTGEELSELLMSMSQTESETYENNLQKLGYADFDIPSGIDIYPKDFESKEEVVRILDDYNADMEACGKEEQVITYTDVVGTLMSSVTDIIDIISYVLIAFVAISLVVSSIMIGVITYISVLERKKEIGILRAIGASRGNISQVFNAETFIIGFGAGLIGIGLTLLILIPGNMFIHYIAGTDQVSAVLPVVPAVVLILLSIGLTLLGGLIPSKKAASSDPVTALRTE